MGPLHPSGASFQTFAFHALRDAIQRALPNLLGIVRVPRHAAFPRPTVAALDEPDFLDDGDADDPSERASAAEDRERVRAALSKLRPRDALVAELRFGITTARDARTP